MKTLTVGGLKKILEKYDDKLKLFITDDGPGHEYPVTKGDIKIIQNPYCGNSVVSNMPKENEDVLRIAII